MILMGSGRRGFDLDGGDSFFLFQNQYLAEKKVGKVEARRHLYKAE